MNRYGLLGAAASVIGALSPIGAACVAAPAATPTAGAHASPMSDAAKIRALERRLDQRDALIRDLQQRVERLERETAAAAPAAASPLQAQAAAPPARPAPPQAVAQAAPPPAAAQAGAPKPGPGQFTVSEEDAQHALERALVQTGAALLPAGKFEFVPSLLYQYQRLSTPGGIAVTTDNRVLITENVARTTLVQASALLRAGLPWDLQLEVGVPWSYKDNTVVSRVSGSGLSATGPNIQGFGDPSVTLIKQILSEGDLRPGLFANVGWNPNVGQFKENVPLGKGVNQYSAGFTAVKRQDPLVFTGGFNYIYSGQHNGFRPGAEYVSSFNVLLAVSPETSLQFGQQLIFYGKDSFGGRGVPGSDRTEGIFSVGLLSVLGRNRVVSFTVGVGETSDSPNIVIQLATPIRLN